MDQARPVVVVVLLPLVQFGILPTGVWPDLKHHTAQDGLFKVRAVRVVAIHLPWIAGAVPDPDPAGIRGLDLHEIDAAAIRQTRDRFASSRTSRPA